MQEFTVSPQDVTAPPDATKTLVAEALSTIGRGANLVTFHRDIGQAVVAIPADALEQLKSALGPGFLVDPRAPLELLGP